MASEDDRGDEHEHKGRVVVVVVLTVLALGIYAWATGQSLFGALDGVLRL